MSTLNKWHRGIRALLALSALCLAVSVFSCAATTGTHALSVAAENVIVGGASDCSDFMNGAAVGLGIGALFGCVWCMAGAVVAKGIALFC